MTIVLNSIEQFSSVVRDVSTVATSADYQNALADFQQTIATQEAGMFAAQMDATGSAWAPLNPSTVKRKKSNRILYDTGALMASLTSVGGSGNISAVSAREMSFGTDIGYATFLQEGTSKMPARPAVGMTVETLDKLVNVIADLTVEKLKAGNN